MRERLISYVDLLFAGNPEAEDIKQEILQNTLDRFDDLVAQGKTPEAAYSLAIAGIGDVSELLGGGSRNAQQQSGTSQNGQQQNGAPYPFPGERETRNSRNKVLKAIAVGLYIICAVPLFIFQNEVGLCLLLVLVAVATVLMVIAGNDKKQKEEEVKLTPRQALKKSIHSAVSTVGMVLYFLLSFFTGAWHITWLIFPLIVAIDGLITAIMDLKEVK